MVNFDTNEYWDLLNNYVFCLHAIRFSPHTNFKYCMHIIMTSSGIHVLDLVNMYVDSSMTIVY